MDDVHAWMVPLDVSQQQYENLLATLAADERQRVYELLGGYRLARRR